MRLLSRLFTLICAVALAACGGGGGSAGTSTFPTDPGTGASVSDIVLVLGADTIINSTASSVTVTATAVDASRKAVSGATIDLSADNDAVLTVTSSSNTTGADGKVTASVGIGSNRANRVITVTAKSGGVTKTAQLSVVNSQGTAVPAAIELISSSTTVGTGGDQITIQAYVKDASNNTLPSTPVSWSTTTGTLSSVTTTSDLAGQASANFSAGNDRSNRSATITVTAGTVSSQITIPIAGTKLTASGPSSLILRDTGQFSVQVVDSRGNALSGIAIAASSALGNALAAVGGGISDANGLVKFNYTANFGGSDTITFTGASATTTASVAVSAVDFAFDSPAPGTQVPVGPTGQLLTVHFNQNGSPVADGTLISFTATSGTLFASSAPTTNGIASVSISGSSAGQATVQATAPNGAATATLALQFVATTPAKIVLQVAPAALSPNTTGSTSSQAKVVAKVTDAIGNPVQGVTVNFSRDADPSGGNLQPPSAVTDSSGQASVQYIAGSESTANNGVVLRGTVASNSAITGTASLTVNQTALFITLGTGNTITNADTQTYKKDWVVYVTDANGVAVAGVTLTTKVLPLHYLRGELVLPDTTWVYGSPIRVCRNEDANNNGILDAGEDYNGDGVLWPGNVVAVSPGTVITDSTGRATVSLLYAESYAPWVNVRLTASATVSGTESRRDAEFILVGSAADFSEAGGPPAGQVSPFGRYATVSSDPTKCADYPTLP